MTEPRMPPATMKHIDMVVDLIGDLLVRPESTAVNVDQVAALVAKGSTQWAWELLEAALTVTETLRDACVQITGAPGLVFSPTDVDASTEVPADVQRGVRDARRMLNTDDGASSTVAARYQNGQATPGEFLGAITMVCYYGASVVTAIAGFTRTPTKRIWKQILPLLIEP